MSDIKPEYKEIPDDEFVPLECVEPELLGNYEINKLGEIRRLDDKKLLHKIHTKIILNIDYPVLIKKIHLEI